MVISPYPMLTETIYIISIHQFCLADGFFRNHLRAWEFSKIWNEWNSDETRSEYTNFQSVKFQLNKFHNFWSLRCTENWVSNPVIILQKDKLWITMQLYTHFLFSAVYLFGIITRTLAKRFYSHPPFYFVY